MKKKQLTYKKESNILFMQTSMIIFLCLLFTLAVFYGLSILEHEFELFNLGERRHILLLSILLIISATLGAIISFVLARHLTKPIKQMKEATNQIAKGNFDVEIKPSKNESINELVDNFNKMAKELKTIETLKEDFISSVSHEFKTPLSVIQSYNKMLSRPNLDKKTRQKYQKVIDNNIQNLTSLTNNILSLSKIENQTLVLDKAEFSVDEQIRQVIVSLEPKWQEKQIEFDLNLQNIKYLGSQTLMYEVWKNLIENAIKFSNKNSKITISAEIVDKDIVVKVADYGIGISQDNITHIFDKFYQADPSHSGLGNGLGLAIVKAMLTMSNGSITVDSEVGKGSTFTVTL